MLWKLGVYHDFSCDYSNCFCESGCSKDTYHMVIDKDMSTSFRSSRPVPASLKPVLHEELQWIIEIKIITSVEGPTNWEKNLILVEKTNRKI